MLTNTRTPPPRGAHQAPRRDGRLVIAVAHDCEIVHQGLARMLEPFAPRVRVVPADTSEGDRAEIVLLDPGPSGAALPDRLRRVTRTDGHPEVVLYGWSFDPGVVSRGLHHGARGFLPKAMPAGKLVEALVQIRNGRVLVIDPQGHRDPVPVHARAGLTTREQEVVSLITSGRSNAEIAGELYLSINSVKTYIRLAYRKMDVASRSQAVLWGIQNGLLPGTDHDADLARPVGVN